MANGIFTTADDPKAQAPAPVDFPITFYDQPTLALSNLVLKQDLDAMTRSLFAPQSLTPSQLETFRTKMLGKNASPLMKTVLDLSTNPLVVISLLLGAKFPIKDVRPLQRIFQGLNGSAQQMSRAMSFLHPAYINLSTIPHLTDDLVEVFRQTDRFKMRFGNKFADMIKKHQKLHGRLTKSQEYQLGAWLQGWHKTDSRLAKTVLEEITDEKGQAVIKRAFKGAPLAPDLESKMGKPLLSLAKQMRGVLDEIYNSWDPKMYARAQRELKQKGIQLGRALDDYYPQMLSFEHLEDRAIRRAVSMTRKGYHEMLKNIAPWKVTGSVRARIGGSIPAPKEVLEMEKLGILRPGVHDTLTKTIVEGAGRLVSQMERDLAIFKNLNRTPMETANSISKTLLNRLQKARVSLKSRLGAAGAQKEFAEGVAWDLVKAYNDPKRQKMLLQQVANTLVAPPQYTMKTTDAISRYMQQMAGTWAWFNTPSRHPTLMRAGRKLREKISVGVAYPDIKKWAKWKGYMDPWQEQLLDDELIPLIRGMKHWRQFSASATFNELKRKMHLWWSTSPPVQSMVKKGIIPKSTYEWTLERLGDTRGSLTAGSLGAAMGQYFYLSTLGGNIGASSKNLLQPVLTLASAPGIGACGLHKCLVGGAGEPGLLRRLGVFHKKLAKTRDLEGAFKTAFPDFVEDIGEGTQVLKALMRGDLAKEGQTATRLVHGPLSGAQKVLMTPFSMSETWNRLWSYYTGKVAYASQIGTGGVEAARRFGTNLMAMTQFSGGPLGMPRGLLGLPPPVRQFMHFPMRMASFLSASTQFGADPTKKDWGTILRTIGYSGIGATVAKNLAGVDISPGLLSGALPAPTYPKAPFYPFPMVPPALSLGGSMVMAAHQGSLEPLEKSWGLMVPGGIALRRLLQTVGPKKADYKNPTPDGRIPVYNKNRALVGAFSPWELTLKRLGLYPTSVQAEQQAAGWLLQQRDKIRDFRRRYLEALSRNDVQQAERINRQFQGDYPELGPLQVKKTDLRTIRNRREISRLHRILKGVPTQYRPLFEMVIGDTSAAAIAQDVEASDIAPALYERLPR